MMGSGATEQRHQATALIQGDQVVAAAHVGVTDEDLRHGTTAGDVHHVGALGRVQVNTDFFNLADAALEQRSGGC